MATPDPPVAEPDPPVVAPEPEQDEPVTPEEERCLLNVGNRRVRGCVTNVVPEPEEPSAPVEEPEEEEPEEEEPASEPVDTPTPPEIVSLVSNRRLRNPLAAVLQPVIGAALAAETNWLDSIDDDEDAATGGI